MQETNRHQATVEITSLKFVNFNSHFDINLMTQFIINKRISNEDMTLTLAGQFKQLSHEPEKFR